jgi:uncharacterized membrane protein
MIALFVLKILHILTAAAWIGGALTVPSDIRRTLLLGPPHSTVLLARIGAVARLMNLSALLTVVTGSAMVLVIGGFESVPRRIHVGLALTLLAIAAGRWLIRPAIAEIAEAAKTPVPAHDVSRLMTKFWVGNGVEHVLRVVVLILMVYPFAF